MIIKNSKGFTLIELMISLAITTLMLAAIANLLSVSIKSSQQTNIQLELQQEARIAMDNMVREIQLANDVRIFADRSTGVFNNVVKSGKCLMIFTDRYGFKHATLQYYIDSNGTLFRGLDNGAVPQPLTGDSNIKVKIKSLEFTDRTPVSQVDSTHSGNWVNLTRVVGIKLIVTDLKERYSHELDTSVTLLSNPQKNQN